MSQRLTIEDRLAALERQVLQLQRKHGSEQSWLETVDGSMQNSPAFDEALRLGSEARNAMTYEREVEPRTFGRSRA